jgi:hypothetical protein
MKQYILKFHIPVKRDGNTNTYTEVFEQHNTQVVQLDTIPSFFISFKLWPKSTALLCWNCTRSFTNCPIGIPVEKNIIMKDKYRNILEIDNGYMILKTKGNFCTFNCAMRYLHLLFKGKEREDIIRNLLFMVKLFCGKTLKHIEPAEPHTSQTRYGGIMSEEEYTAHLNEINPYNLESNSSGIKMTLIIDDDIDSLDLKTN